ncbi:hypothetical protein GQ44DRAFT_722944 [Phaeosphaeriaceae sp. PMI808]|nr:hypothetical protein GQ44DRAFT_722944 [Phaeosphaeriaceae sp. PMI808]
MYSLDQCCCPKALTQHSKPLPGVAFLSSLILLRPFDASSVLSIAGGVNVVNQPNVCETPKPEWNGSRCDRYEPVSSFSKDVDAHHWPVDYFDRRLGTSYALDDVFLAEFFMMETKRKATGPVMCCIYSPDFNAKRVRSMEWISKRLSKAPRRRLSGISRVMAKAIICWSTLSPSIEA